MTIECCEYGFPPVIGTLEEENVLKDYLTSQKDVAQINQEIYDSHTQKHTLAMEH